jgi:DNA-binding MarR family transcriptional regulator
MDMQMAPEITSNEDTAQVDMLEALQDRLDNVALLLFRRLSAVSEFTFSPVVFTVLRHLNRSGAMPVGQISNAIGRAQSTTSELLSRLRKHGLVAHVRSDQDIRVVAVNITRKGRDALRSAEMKRCDVWTDLLGRLTTSDRLALGSTMRQVSKILGEGSGEPTLPRV